MENESGKNMEVSPIAENAAEIKKDKKEKKHKKKKRKDRKKKRNVVSPDTQITPGKHIFSF